MGAARKGFVCIFIESVLCNIIVIIMVTLGSYFNDLNTVIMKFLAGIPDVTIVSLVKHQESFQISKPGSPGKADDQYNWRTV